ncbi:HEPN domain protein [Desulforamulus reducens MI-1]|uniref:HEPN domain protein n=1 Tax=Desulforamulus reducens (strain ATCC BAA-1160 / DSM 100696 / MI-1) TaxID=349161 RepID=A4J2X9_DESRM|nr:HEPN domain-containing protein [Desulforamulus reducens]ABO49432.1 HEPN domain protein [Desulforamulus reducens MI-1]
MKEQTHYWVSESEEDIVTAKILVKSGRLLESVFFCHLALEKMLKAFIAERNNEMPPKSHNLLFLAKKSNLVKELDEETVDLIAEVQPFNIEGRYPEMRDKLYKSTTPDRFKAMVHRTEEKVKWLKEKLS